MIYTPINKNEWPRREIFDFFSGLADPFYMVSFNADITGLCEFAKRNGLSLYHCTVKLVTDAVNSIGAFRCAAQAGDIVLLEKRRPSFTHLDKGSELFRIITMPCEGGYEDFCAAAKARIAEQKKFIDPQEEGIDLIYISCLPWLDMTALTNEHDVGTEEAKLDSVPRIAWGRIKDESGRKKVNISVEVNHRFIDGVHIGMLAKKIEEMSEELKRNY